MKRLITIALLAVAVQSCKHSEHIKQNEYAVFEGYPIHHEADFETEAVFVPVELENIHSEGDTVYIDSANFIVDPLIRDAETRQPVTAGLTRVILHDRVYPNKLINR